MKIIGEKNDFEEKLKSNELFLITDSESGSKSVFPIIPDNNSKTVLVHVDKGLIRNLQKNCRVCDKLLFVDNTLFENKKNISVTCLVELKGTSNEDEVLGAIDQLCQTFNYEEVKKYTFRKSFIFAFIVGAPSKKLPRLLNTNPELKKLSKLIYAKCTLRSSIKNISNLVFYVQLDKNRKNALFEGNVAPYTISCYKTQYAAVPFPSMILKKIENGA